MGKDVSAGEARRGAREVGELITVEEILERAKRLPPPVDAFDQMTLTSVGSSLRAINNVRDEFADKRRRCIEEVRNKRENVASGLIEAIAPRFLGITCSLGVGVWPGDEGKAHRRPKDDQVREPPDPGPFREALEATEEGCRALVKKWMFIREGFGPEKKHNWVATDNFVLVRLLGKRPIDGLADPEIAEIFLASNAFEQCRDSAYVLIGLELGLARTKTFIERIRVCAGSRAVAGDPERGKAVIVEVVERNIARLEARALELSRQYPIEEEERKAAEEFESSPAAVMLKQEEKKYLRDALSSIKNLEKWTRGRKRGNEWLRRRQILMPLKEVRMPEIAEIGNSAVLDLTRKG